MRTFSNVCFGLGVFLGIAGTVYGLTAYEWAGTAALLAAGLTFIGLGALTRTVARGLVDEGAPEEEHEELVHVGPTIWPFAFAVSGVILALGLIVSPWILIVAVAGLAFSAAGWLRDVTRSHAAHG